MVGCAAPSTDADLEARSTLCVVTETYAPEVNGVAMTLGRLVEGLLERGHPIQLVKPRVRPEKEAGERGNLEVLSVRGGPLWTYEGLQFGFPAHRALGRLWRQSPPDAVYVATEGPLGWSAMRVARRLGIRILSGFHTNFHAYSRHYGIGWMRRVVFGYLRYFHNRTDGTLVPSDTMREVLDRDGFRNVHTLSRGVDCSLFSPNKRSRELRREWGVRPGGGVALYVGRIAAEKNIDLAVRAFRYMEAVNPSLRFVLVGDGPDRASLEQGNPDFVFCGTRRGEDLARHYASGDIFLFPSTTETFGNVTLEAMASGLAVVAFDYAAAHMHIEHGMRGMLASTGEGDSFIDLACYLAKDVTLADQMGHAARTHAQTQGWERIVRRFEQLLAGEPDRS